LSHVMTFHSTIHRYRYLYRSTKFAYPIGADWKWYVQCHQAHCMCSTNVTEISLIKCINWTIKLMTKRNDRQIVVYRFWVPGQIHCLSIYSVQ
jgi:hypothetical protein